MDFAAALPPPPRSASAPPARGAAADARRAGQSGGSAASDMDISDAPGAPSAPSPGLSLDALALGVATADVAQGTVGGTEGSRIAVSYPYHSPAIRRVEM